MPRIIVLRLFRWGPWLGFHLNDYEEATEARFGLSSSHASARVCRHLS